MEVFGLYFYLIAFHHVISDGLGGPSEALQHPHA
jgi:hypothetical protein